jgi:hypothetical protein
VGAALFTVGPAELRPMAHNQLILPSHGCPRAALSFAQPPLSRHSESVFCPRNPSPPRAPHVPRFHAGFFIDSNSTQKTLVILSGAKDLNRRVLPPLCRQDPNPCHPEQSEVPSFVDCGALAPLFPRVGSALLRINLPRLPHVALSRVGISVVFNLNAECCHPELAYRRQRSEGPQPSRLASPCHPEHSEGPAFPRDLAVPAP